MTRACRYTPHRLPALALALCVLAGCGGTAIRRYQPAVVEPMLQGKSGPRGACVLSVSTFAADAALDDPRIVYRESPHRFDYYHFHRWSARPGELASTTLREVMRRMSRFRAVVGGLDTRADEVLHGRVVAFEEVDGEGDTWQAHVALELTLRDNRTGELLWSELVQAREPIEERTPEGVAQAISRALTTLGMQVAEQVAQIHSCG